MPPSPPLTQKVIDKLEPPPSSWRVMFDGHRDAPKGFGVRVTAKGQKAFVLRYTFEGRRRLKVIGEVGTWTLTAAREEAKSIRREVDSGVDVVQAKRERRKQMTMAKLVARYCEEHADRLKTGNAIRAAFERELLPQLGSVKAVDVTRADIRALVKYKALTTPRAAALLLSYTKTLLEWAADEDIIPLNPAAGLSAKRVNKAMLTKRRRRVLDEGEQTTLWQNAEAVGLHKLTAICLKLILLTGQRPGEVAGMQWDEIDGDIWLIPAHRRLKTEQSHLVPLCDTALDLLDQAKAEVSRLSIRRSWKPSGFVFEARESGPLTTHALGRAVRRKVAELGNKHADEWGHWTPHDLRRTMRTGLSAAGVSQEVAERVIGHVSGAMVETYNQHAYEAEKRLAVEAWERRLLQLVRGDSAGGNVITMSARRIGAPDAGGAQ